VVLFFISFLNLSHHTLPQGLEGAAERLLEVEDEVVNAAPPEVKEGQPVGQQLEQSEAAKVCLSCYKRIFSCCVGPPGARVLS
jgi:hypothetical protein